jgi:hypothetical protein
MSFDFSIITPQLIGGSVPWTDEDAKTLVSLGVTHVINCLEVKDNFTAWTGETCLIPQSDDGQPRPFGLLRKCVEYYNASTCSGRIVCVHCGMGINRAPTMAYAILRSSGKTTNPHDCIWRVRRREDNFRWLQPAEAQSDTLSISRQRHLGVRIIGPARTRRTPAVVLCFAFTPRMECRSRRGLHRMVDFQL